MTKGQLQKSLDEARADCRAHQREIAKRSKENAILRSKITVLENRIAHWKDSMSSLREFFEAIIKV